MSNYQLGPIWLDFWPGLRVQFRPVSPSAQLASRRAVRGVLSDAEDAQGLEAYEDAAGALERAIVKAGIVAWEGIDAPVSPEAVDLFVQDAVLMKRANELYVAPYLARDAEKNVSAVSPSGNSVGRTAAKPSAKTAPRSARPALTKSKPRKPK